MKQLDAAILMYRFGLSRASGGERHSLEETAAWLSERGFVDVADGDADAHPFTRERVRAREARVLAELRRLAGVVGAS